MSSPSPCSEVVCPRSALEPGLLYTWLQLCSHQAALSAPQEIVDDALIITSKSGYDVPEVCVFNHSQAQPQSQVAMQEGRDVWWQDVVAKQEPTCEVEWLEAEEPLFKVGARLHKGGQALIAGWLCFGLLCGTTSGQS